MLCPVFECGHCGRPCSNLAQHLRRHPECDEDEDEDPADCDALVERLAHDDLRRLVASDLADLRLEHGYGSAEIDRLKCVVNKWVAERDAIAAARLEPLLR